MTSRQLFRKSNLIEIPLKSAISSYSDQLILEIMSIKGFIAHRTFLTNRITDLPPVPTFTSISTGIYTSKDYLYGRSQMIPI